MTNTLTTRAEKLCLWAGLMLSVLGLAYYATHPDESRLMMLDIQIFSLPFWLRAILATLLGLSMGAIKRKSEGAYLFVFGGLFVLLLTMSYFSWSYLGWWTTFLEIGSATLFITVGECIAAYSKAGGVDDMTPRH